MSDKQVEEENAYKKYSIHSEHALCVTASSISNICASCNYYYTCSICKKVYNDIKESILWIEGKLWEFTYDPPPPPSSLINGLLKLQMTKKNSSAGDNKTTAAEMIFWYWNAKKEIAILHQKVHDDFSNQSESISELPVNKKFNVVIRLLDKREENDNKSLLESYYGDFGPGEIEMVTLRICDIKGETEASFTVPKYVLMQASPVFHRMFTAEMTEKATGEVKIEDTNAEEFGDFLKAISPKQEHPNPSNVRALLKLADRYECQLLRNRCEAHLMNCIEIPLVERAKCANFYGLKDLKQNLLMHLEGSGILQMYRDTKPQLDLLNELQQLIE